MTTSVLPISPHRWAVASASQPGYFVLVELEPGVRVSCTCPAGQRMAGKRIRSACERGVCRHVREVVDWLRDELAGVA